MNNIPDNYELWEKHDSQLQADLAELPECDWCGENIQEEHYYDIDGDKVCDECIKSARRLI